MKHKKSSDHGMKSDAKRAAIKALRKSMGKMSEHGGEKVSAQVTAKDPESLKEGLEKAAEMVGYAKEEKEEYKEKEMDDYDDMSKEDLIKLLKSR